MHFLIFFLHRNYPGTPAVENGVLNQEREHPVPFRINIIYLHTNCY